MSQRVTRQAHGLAQIRRAAAHAAKRADDKDARRGVPRHAPSQIGQ